VDETGVSRRRGPVGGPGEGGSCTGNYEIYLKEGSGCGVPLSMGALLGEPGGGAFAGCPEGYERKAVGTGISLHWGSVGQTGVGLSAGTLRYG
jgi:hypothetical protein